MTSQISKAAAFPALVWPRPSSSRLRPGASAGPRVTRGAAMGSASGWPAARRKGRSWRRAAAADADARGGPAADVGGWGPGTAASIDLPGQLPMTRRTFQHVDQAVVHSALSIALYIARRHRSVAAPARRRMSVNNDNPYHKIGVQPFINCCGSRTIHSGTLMWPEVTAAMVAASKSFVNMDELMSGVGQRLAELTGAEWGIVTSGAAAALCHATAACVTDGNPEKMLRLPNTEGLKNCVIMMADGRFTYDHAIRSVGVEVLNVQPDDLPKALDDRVAMVALLGSREAERLDVFEKMVASARSKNIPVLVDAASEHLQRPDPYLTRGATMVAYSGGKYLRGPQPTGLLLGEKKWIEAAWCCAAPHHTLGRAMKVGKEEVMGVLAAVEHWATHRDHNAEQAQWHTDLETITNFVTQIKTVTTTISPGESRRSPVPRLEIRWDSQQIGISGLTVRERLLNRRPRIMLDDRGATDSSLLILPFSLQPGEAEIVGQAIRNVLASAGPAVEEAEPTSSQVAGEWKIQITYTDAQAAHQVVLHQNNAVLSGSHHTLFLEGPLSGTIFGSNIDIVSQIPFEGTHLVHHFVGTVAGDQASGVVELGSSGQSAPGPLNQREYGTFQWRGKRAD